MEDGIESKWSTRGDSGHANDLLSLHRRRNLPPPRIRSPVPLERVQRCEDVLDAARGEAAG